jgi:hypothetical protein
MVKLVDTCRNFGRSAALHPHRAVRPLTFSPCRFRWRSHHHPDDRQRIRTGRHQGHQGHRSRQDHQGQRSHQRSRQLRADSHNPSTRNDHEPRPRSRRLACSGNDTPSTATPPLGQLLETGTETCIPFYIALTALGPGTLNIRRPADDLDTMN